MQVHIPICAAATALTALLAVSAASDAAAQTFEVFVAPDGSDTWSGALPEPNADNTDGPLATLRRARDVIRAAKQENDQRQFAVTVRQGTYYLEEPLTLGPEDSGTEDMPVIWRAYDGERVVISGGKPITSHWQAEDGRIYTTTLSEVADGEWYFRLLRVGDEWAIRARYPNYDPEHPYTGGWLFTKPSGRAKGQFGKTVGNIHNRGDMMQWVVEVPAEGDYHVFHYYAAQNEPFGRTDMGGRMTFTVDDREPVLLHNFPDTGGWQAFKWSQKNATLHLEEGKHTIKWTNTEGGGINYDAFVLCDDPDWTPKGTPPQPPPEGNHMIVVHAETFVECKGEELSVNLPASRRDFGFAEGELKQWPKSDNIQMHVFPAWGWVSSIEPIAEIDLEDCVATIAGRKANQEIRVGNRYYLENILEELDMPGEWYLQRDSGKLHYWPKDEDFQQKEIVAPAHDRIIHIKATPENASDTGYIQLIGFTFKDTGYTPRIDSPYYPPDAAIWIENATGCVIENCRFTRIGGSALNLVGAATNNRFLGNTVEYVGENGVFMVGGPEDRPFPNQNTVAGCHMHHIGLIYKHVAGVYIGRRHPQLAPQPGNLIAHNLITDCPRYAIGIKMNQGNSVVEYNEIHRTNLETNDTGGIESCVRNRDAPGNTIRYNIVFDSIGLKTTPSGEILRPYYTWGIYLDDHSSSAHVYGNICAGNYRAGVHVHGGQKNVIENNILAESHQQHAEFNNIRGQMVDNVFRRNICYRTEEGGQMMRSGGWNEDVLAEADNNVFWSTAEESPQIFPGKSLDEWRAMGYGEHSAVADPMFTDPENRDYTLAEGSPALQLGFEPIPVEKIGLAGYDRADY